MSLQRAFVEEQVDAGRPRPTASATARELEALHAHDPEAVSRLVHQQRDKLYRFINRFVSDPDETADLVQETFFQALRSLPTFRNQAKLTTWLYGIATNVTLTRLRKVRRLHVLSEAEMEALQPCFTAQGAHAEHYPEWDPDQVVQQRERARILQRAMDQLPEKYRKVVVMRDLEECSTAEVAEALGISEENVRVRLFRSRNALRKLLASYFAVPDPTSPR